MADQRPRNVDPGTRLILEELRDLRVEMRADRRRADEERRRSDERFDRMMREFEQNSARREAATQRAFKDIRAVGLSIVKTLNHHTRILERIERKLPGGNGGPWHEDGGGAHPRR